MPDTGRRRQAVIHGARCAPSHRSSVGRIHIRDGRIASLADHAGVATSHPETCLIDLNGMLVMPGLINAHDHLQFALHPRLADPPYPNYVAWGDDIHAKYGAVFERYRSVSRDVRLWWGSLRNLLCGVTTVCHHDPFWPELKRPDFPVRVAADCAWAHSVALDRKRCEDYSALPRGKVFIVHACEGTDAQSREEFFTLDRLGLLRANTVLVHGLAIDEAQLALIASRGVSLILCPSSNEFLFHTLPAASVVGAATNVVLGSDSPLTSEGDLLDEVRFAMRSCHIPPATAYRMVTEAAAATLHLAAGEGTIRVGGVADLIAVRDKGQDEAEGLASMTMADVEFVMVAGRVNLASQRIFDRLPAPERRGLEPLWIGGVTRWLRAPVKRLLRAAEAVLGAGEVRLGGRAITIPAHGPLPRPDAAPIWAQRL